MDREGTGSIPSRYSKRMDRTMWVPKGLPILVKAFGITWIMTIDNRTILYSE